MRFGKPEKKPRARVIHPEEAEETRPVAPTEAVPEELIGEEKVVWDASGGHHHDGTISRAVDYPTLTNRTHSLTGADHSLSGTEGQFLVIQSGGASAAFEAPGTHVIRAGTLASRPVATAVPAGTLYLATDENGGTLYRSTGSAWGQCGAAVSHALTGHTLTGSTAGFILAATGATTYALEAPGTRVIRAGTLASRPAATTVPAGTLYLATDDNGGTFYRSTGSAWGQCGAGASHNHALTGLTLSGATDGTLLVATGATSYGLEALTTRISRSGAGSPQGTVSGLAGALYLNTTDNSLWRCTSGTNWVQITAVGTTDAPVNTQYVVLAADATLTNEQVLGTAVIMAGLATARPAASVAGRLYLATDTNGGTLYRDTGSAWVQLAPGVTEAPQAHSLTGAQHTVSSTEGFVPVVQAGGASVALEAPGTHLVRSGAGAPAGAQPTGTLYLDTTNLILYRYSGATWVQVAAPATHTLGGSTHADFTGSPSTGALIYRNGSSQWAPLGIGSTDQILKVNGSGLPSWAAVNSVATSRALIQGWKREDIRNADTSDGEMNGFDGLRTGECMAYGGTLVGIAVALERDIDNGGAQPAASYTLTAYKSSNQGLSWSATTATVTLSAGAGNERRAYATGFSVSFAAGDLLTIFDRKGSLPAVANGCKANLIVVFS